MACIILLQGCSGMYKLETLQSLCSSFATSSRTIFDYLDYLKVLMNSAYKGELRDAKQYIVAAIVTAVVLSLVTIFFFIPFRAGVWTGQRATKHKVHRYMGLCFLIQYALVWVEFLTNDIGTGKLGFIPHTMALNGMCCVAKGRHLYIDEAVKSVTNPFFLYLSDLSFPQVLFRGTLLTFPSKYCLNWRMLDTIQTKASSPETLCMKTYSFSA